MPGELGHFVDLVARFEQPADAFVAQIVEMQVFDAQPLAGAGEIALGGNGVVGEDAVAGAGLALNDRQRLPCELDDDVIALAALGAFQTRVKVAPGESVRIMRVDSAA